MIRRSLAAIIALALVSGALLAQSIPFPGPGGVVPSSSCGSVVVTTLGTAGNTSGSSLTLTVSNSVVAGDLIFVAVMERGSLGSSTGTLADSAGNSYSMDRAAHPNATDSAGQGMMFHAWNANALTSGVSTITYTKVGTASTAMSALTATCIQNSSDPLDLNTTPTTGSGTSPSITSGTPAVSNELFVAALAVASGTGDAFTQDTGNGWAAPPDRVDATVPVTASVRGGNLFNAGSSAKTYAPTIGSRSWAAFILSFKSR